MTFEQLGILLSLLLTILGWSVTAYYQKQILERQIAVEREKEIRQLVIPRKIQQLETIKKWVENGSLLWHLWKKRDYKNYKEEEEKRGKIETDILNWTKVEYMSIEALLDTIEPYEKMMKSEGTLTQLISQLVDAMPTREKDRYYYGQDSDLDWKTEHVFYNNYPEIMRMLNNLIDQAAKERM